MNRKTASLSLSKVIFSTVSLFALLPLGSRVVNAEVVINEFSSPTSDDWVELYSNTDVDVSGYILRDTASSIIKTIPSNTFVGPSTNMFYIIDASNRLNADTDNIRLLKSNDVDVVDSVEYGSGTDLCVATGSETSGRFPDGTGSFTRFTEGTRGGSNTSSENKCPVPTNTPTPVPSNTLTSTPTPTLTPTPTIVPTTTFTPTPKPTLSATQNPSPLPTLEDEGSVLSFSETFGNDGLSPSPAIAEGTVVPGEGKSFPLLAAGFIAGGLGFFGYAGYSFFTRFKKGYNPTHDNEENSTED